MGGTATVLVSCSHDAVTVRAGEQVGLLSSVVEVQPSSSGEVCVSAHLAPLEARVFLEAVNLPEIVGGLSHLSDQQREVVLQILENNKEVFATDDSDVGQMGVTKHKIELWDDIPIY